jgi:hypothetical protein
MIAPNYSNRSSLGVKIRSLLSMRQKKGCKSLNNIGKRAGIHSDLLDERRPLLLFRRVAGEG